jgi:hypothetical protein
VNLRASVSGFREVGVRYYSRVKHINHTANVSEIDFDGKIFLLFQTDPKPEPSSLPLSDKVVPRSVRQPQPGRSPKLTRGCAEGHELASVDGDEAGVDAVELWVRQEVRVRDAGGGPGRGGRLPRPAAARDGRSGRCVGHEGDEAGLVAHVGQAGARLRRAARVECDAGRRLAENGARG